jgi:hypothetical protein
MTTRKAKKKPSTKRPATDAISLLKADHRQVLSERIKHHVKEEEQRGGMFAEAKQSNRDLTALGAQLASRKQQLMGNEA